MVIYDIGSCNGLGLGVCSVYLLAWNFPQRLSGIETIVGFCLL